MSTYFHTKYSTGLKALSFCALITGYNTVMPIETFYKVASKIGLPLLIEYHCNKGQLVNAAINFVRGHTVTLPLNAAAFASPVSLGVNLLIQFVDKKFSSKFPITDSVHCNSRVVIFNKKNIALRLLIPFILQFGVICFSKDTLKNKKFYSFVSLVNTLIANYSITTALIKSFK